MVIKRFDVFLVELNPVRGSEIMKTRPCLVVSPDEMNENLRTVIIAPMTSQGKLYPSRLNCTFQGTSGYILIDQIRSVDKIRIHKKLGVIDLDVHKRVCDLMCETFEY